MKMVIEEMILSVNTNKKNQTIVFAMTRKIENHQSLFPAKDYDFRV